MKGIYLIDLIGNIRISKGGPEENGFAHMEEKEEGIRKFGGGTKRKICLENECN